MALKYRRILLKLSGEALMGKEKFGIEYTACEHIAKSIKEVSDHGVEIGVVIGGGNIFRGAQAEHFGFARTPADQIGMIATSINGIVLQQALSVVGCKSRVMSAISCDGIIEPFNWQETLLYLEKGIIVIFVGGTGNPYFTTDTAAALRASEIDAEILLKATKVDGIYDKDPIKHRDAKKFTHLSYSEALTKKLNIMDATAIALCRENKIPICVFNLFEKGAFLNALSQKEGGTIVSGE